MMFRATAAACLVVFATGLSSAQEIRTFTTQAPPGGVPMMMPPRDANAKPGTAVIRGRVVAADTGQPLRKAAVRAISPDARENRSVSTDADGKFELKELPAGRYNVSVSKGSYVSLSYGQTRPFEAGKPLEIAEGQTVEKVDFTLPRGGILTGRILDEFGEAIADVAVSPMRYQFVQGRRQLTPAGRVAMTNDIGEYRIFGLAPGQYFLSATNRGSGAGGPGAIIINTMMGGTDDRSGYAPTYYPGTPNVAEAQRITVGLGQTIAEMNMSLVPTRTARVSGTAVDSTGKPLGGAIIMMMQRTGASISGMSTGQVKPDGSFQLGGVSPGEYMVQAITPNAAFGDTAEWASAQITVAGEDLTGVQLVGQKSVAVTGRVLVDPALTKSLPPSSLRLMAIPARPEDMMAGIGAGKVNDDYSFEVKARPGLALIRLPQLPMGFSLKAVRHSASDVTDSGLEIRPSEEISGVEVEITNRVTELSGAVTNARSEPVRDYSVVVFAREREKWGSQSRFFQTGRPDQDGRYKLRGLPPGEYYAVALDYLEPGEATDPEFLDRVKARATTLSLNEGETKVLDLKIQSPTS